ncbi:MAG: nucleotidyltransferase family protein [Clostridia bacterium]|nr:nucleotidyltransferase family protein [Clostridia bacterium]
MKKYAAVIPAAGLSSRMKQFKPLMPLAGKAMIDHVIDTLEAAGVSRIIIVAGHNAQLLTEHLSGRGVQIVVNSQYATSQMFDSVKIGLAALEDDFEGVYITPGDVPLFRLETVLALRECEADAVRPLCGAKGGHPLYLRMKAARYVQACSAEGGLKEALRSIPLTDLPVQDRGSAMDADTPEAFETLKCFLHHEKRD